MRVRFTAMALGVAIALAAPAAAADEPQGGDALGPLRDRFKEGSEKYKNGDFAGALEIWKGVYTELGKDKGYRLAFNIARAYEQLAATHAGLPTALDEATQASEHYAAYVAQTTKRHEAGETLEPLIEKQEAEAKERLSSIVIDGPPGTIAKVDGGEDLHNGATVWVVPGGHIVTFRPGTDNEEIMQRLLRVGQEVHVAPKARPLPAIFQKPLIPKFELREERPYPLSIVLTAGAATVVSFALPIAFFAAADHIHDTYDDTIKGYDTAERTSLHHDYGVARTTYYWSFMVPGILGAATIGLASYWLTHGSMKRIQVGRSGLGTSF